MALKSPLMPSPTTGLAANFSPFSDSPNSPAPYGSFPASERTMPEKIESEKRSSNTSDSLAPPPSPYPQTTDPSPVDSNGTDRTDIEEEAQEEAALQPGDGARGNDLSSPDVEIKSPESATSERVPLIDTDLPPQESTDHTPQSVIHAPSNFKDFEASAANPESPADESDHAVGSPSTPDALHNPEERKQSSVSPVTTDVARYVDLSTPRAHTRQDLDDRRSIRSSSLEDIPENQDTDRSEKASKAMFAGNDIVTHSIEVSLGNAEEQVTNLRTALSECWTLCNTLATLSSTHRQRTFKFSGKQQVQEQAWRSCWRLCQQLYERRDEDHNSQVLPTLELCRDFCQSLFEARQKSDEDSDSVLRVSFELNNHLYNTHDRTLPEAFSERTLDFYVTLCHRLMKQRTSLPQETDALLRACWNLAEMLFNLRQVTREGKNSDEELLGSAVQACWDLCDLFREGWTQIRPDRGTPRPSQTNFPYMSSSRSESSRSVRSNSARSQKLGEVDPHAMPPETPSTVFDDSSTANSSPDREDVPHILVLGPASTASTGNTLRKGTTQNERWSSNASALSGYSESSTTSSQRTSSTATAESNEVQLVRLRCLLLRAAMNTGYSRTSGQRLPEYVQSLSRSAFGSLPWQEKVFGYYINVVTGDRSMDTVQTLPSRRLGASEVAKAVRWLGTGEKWAWMRDLYRIVFGFGIDEAGRRGGSFQI